MTFNFEYQKSDYQWDWGLPSVSPEIFRVPISRNLGEPDIDDATAQTTRISYILEHQLSENWKFRNQFSAILSILDNRRVTPLSIQEDRRTIDHFADSSYDSDSQSYTLQNEVIGKFQTGSVAHQVLLGVELLRRRDSLEGFGFDGPVKTSIDLFNPVYGLEGKFFSTGKPSINVSDGLGLYVQDQITLLENLKLLLGGRFD
ncbi:MAG: TonB-dependent receptor [Nostoc sp.]|uniref:TonB-dependent receptor domain-containing protein n=1 Tax=Nostoc sp. TaxID=1180 RepID=UPI002FF7C18E